MANMPKLTKTKVSLQLENEVIVALDIKAEADKTSRNSVANYLLYNALEKIIEGFTEEDLAKVDALEARNAEARNAGR